jgi:hypothetical protein
MVDLILFVFVIAVFYAGFWCGAKFGTIKNAIAHVRGLLSKAAGSGPKDGA